MANKFNKVTQQLVRPKVCKPPPPEPVTVTCEIRPNPATSIDEDLIPCELRCSNPSLQTTENASIEVLDPSSMNWEILTVQNDGEWHDNELDPDSPPGDYETITRFTWSDGKTCDFTQDIIVT